MEPSIKRCTLALIMCGLSAIGMAQEIFSESFTGYPNDVVANIEGWTFYKCVTRTTSTLWPTSVLSIEKNSKTGDKYGYATTPILNNTDNTIRAILYFKMASLGASSKSEINISIPNNKGSIDGAGSVNTTATGQTLRKKTFLLSLSKDAKIKFLLKSNDYAAIDDIVIVKDTLSEGTDNQYYLTAHNDKETDVHTKRTLTGGIWNTLCLPFNVTKATMEAVLGENQDVQLRTYTGFANNVMTFSEVTGDNVITAGTPFLLKLNTTVTNPTFNSVTVSNSTAAQTVTRGDVSFIGTYSQKELATDGTELFITTSGGLAIPTTTGNLMNGMRAYIKVPESMKFTPNGVRLAIDNETTSIQSVMTTSQPDAVYNLSGQRLQQPRKGLNIVRKNRKLIFIR